MIVSNNKFNSVAGIVNAIPITSKRFGRYSPVHVNLKAGEVKGLPVDSTVMCENECSLNVADCTEKIGKLNDEQLEQVAYAMLLQKPFLASAFNKGYEKTPMFKKLAAF